MQKAMRQLSGLLMAAAASPLLLMSAGAVPDTSAGQPVPTLAAPRSITADFTRVSGPRDLSQELCVGSGNAWLGLRSEWQQHLALVHQECGFRYLRFHGILCDQMDVYHEDAQGRAFYHWDKVDAVYGAMLKAGVKPFVEISFMPQVLASDPNKLGFLKRVNTSPPNDYAKWTALITAFTKHLEDHFGRKEVKTWYFEIWNEPNHPGFFTTHLDDYKKLYAATAPAIKDVCADYQVGGPSTAGPAWITELIDYCHENNLPLDFISTHAYGNAGGTDPAGHPIKILNPSPNAVVGIPVGTRAKIDASVMPHLPLYITEWSSSYSDRDAVHDSYFQAPYILEKLKRINSAAAMAYWDFTDIFDENGFAPSPFHGGFGLINREGLKKPAFYAYHYLHKLGHTELTNTDPSSWDCKHVRTLTALVWDFHQPTEDADNNIFFARDMPAHDIAPILLTITNLPRGVYTLKIHRTGYHHNDVLGSYHALGSPPTLTPDQVTQLAQANNDAPERTAKVTIGPDGTFTETLPMRGNDVVFLSLTPMK